MTTNPHDALLKRADEWLEACEWWRDTTNGTVRDDLIRDLANALRKAVEEERCSTCDGSGDVHRADGEWLGPCSICKPAKAEVCPTCKGTGQHCVGTSGSDADGNAPVLERCPECGYGDTPTAERGGPTTEDLEAHKAGKCEGDCGFCFAEFRVWKALKCGLKLQIRQPEEYSAAPEPPKT